MTKRIFEKELPSFLVEFNFMYNHKIIGSEFSTFTCKEKGVKISDGSIFIAENCLKLYAGKSIVIINFTSIVNLIVKNDIVSITANESNHAEIEFSRNEHSTVFLSQLKNVLSLKLIKEGLKKII